MLPVNCGSHSDYQNFVVENLRKYYPNPDAIPRDTWDIIDRFWKRHFCRMRLAVFPAIYRSIADAKFFSKLSL